MTIVNGTVPLALRTLGYDDHEIEQIVAHINENSTIVGAPALKEEHMPVFDVAVGTRSISHMGHIKMMGATQPFISGAISKTVNMPQTATVDDIAEAYVEAWRLGVKALAIYRDGSKTAQALRTEAQNESEADDKVVLTAEEYDHALEQARAESNGRPRNGSASGEPNACRIRVVPGTDPATTLAALRQVCAEHPGRVPVFLHLHVESQEIVVRARGLAVDASPELCAKAEALLGAGAITVEYAGRA
jgi:ribonucleotide reductase alpha subunit